jgi:hypothetical protein
MTREEGAALVAAWKDSGLSARAFCDARGVGPHRLRYWSSMMEEESIRPARDPFFVIPFEDQEATGRAAAVSSAEEPIEVDVSDGVVIRIRWGSSGRGLEETLRAVLTAVRA